MAAANIYFWTKKDEVCCLAMACPAAAKHPAIVIRSTKKAISPFFAAWRVKAGRHAKAFITEMTFAVVAISTMGFFSCLSGDTAIILGTAKRPAICVRTGGDVSHCRRRVFFAASNGFIAGYVPYAVVAAGKAVKRHYEAIRPAVKAVLVVGAFLRDNDVRLFWVSAHISKRCRDKGQLNFSDTFKHWTKETYPFSACQKAVKHYV